MLQIGALERALKEFMFGWLKHKPSMASALEMETRSSLVYCKERDSKTYEDCNVTVNFLFKTYSPTLGVYRDISLPIL